MTNSKKGNKTKMDESKTIKLEIYGIGGEIVVGDISGFQSNIGEAFDDLRAQFEIPEWFEIDNLLHMYGPFINDLDSCTIKVTINDIELINCKPNELEDSNGDQILKFEECYFETDEHQIFTGVNSEKGCVFSSNITLPYNEEFSIDNLKLYSKELMVDDEIINQCIYKIEYKGKEISNDDSSTRGFGLEVQLHG
jgi:hypothetical protein